MKNLKDYVDQRNSWNAIFGGKGLDINNAADRKQIAGCIDADLSPENLHCDGEISQAEAQRKYRRLVKVANELFKLDPAMRKEIYEL